MAYFKKDRRVSFKAISWTILLVSSIYNRLIKQRKKVTILYGTETGQSKRFANQAVNIFMSTFRCTILPLDHENLYENMRSSVFIIITISTSTTAKTQIYKDKDNCKHKDIYRAKDNGILTICLAYQEDLL